jgi:outer membrane protein
MVRARLAVEDARMALRQVAADAPLLSSTPWGALDASASISRSEASKSGYSLHGKTDGSASGALSLDILIYDFGRNAAEARALSEEVIAAETTLISTGYSVFEEVSTGYFTLLRNEALFEVALTNEAEYAEHLEQAELRKEQGEAKELDVLKAKLDLAKAVQNVVAASNDVVTAGAELMAALGERADYRDMAVQSVTYKLYEGRQAYYVVLQGEGEATHPVYVFADGSIIDGAE